MIDTAAMAALSAIPERLLVREVLHCCQAINGRYVWSQGSGDAGERFACGPGAEIPLTQQQLIGRLTELGWLLRKVNQLCASLGALQSVVHEAVVAAAQREVSNYYRLVAILEAQAQQQVAADGGGGGGPAPLPTSGGGDENQLTLRRLEVWLAEPLARLRVLAGCLEACRGAAGGEVLTALHALSKHGDPLVRKVVAPVLEAAAVPFFAQISRWVLDGALEAGGAGFMVRRSGGGGPAGDLPAALWRVGHRLDPGMQPSFLSDELAQQILTTGKTVSFLRECCADTQWAALLEGAAAQLGAGGSMQAQLRLLEQGVGEASRAVSTHLLGILLRQHRLGAHLAALKRYLLLSQGDFVRGMLDLAEAELDRPAREASQYALQGHLDAALRSCSTAGEEADVQQRLDVKLGRSMEGDRGWDVFALSYHVDGPLAAVLTPDAMNVYLRIFRLLWTIKHTDHALARAWHALNGIEHALATLRHIDRQEGIEVENADKVPGVLRFFHARRGEMAQLVAALQQYAAYEVVEPLWAALTAALPRCASLDDVIQRHEATLAAICSGLFLSPEGGGGGAALLTGLPGAGAADVQAGLRAMLRSVLDIQGPIRRLEAAVEQSVAEAQLYMQRTKESESTGQWTEAVHESPCISEDLLGEVQGGMRRVHTIFDRNLRTVLSLLPAHSERDLRFFLLRGDADAGAELMA